MDNYRYTANGDEKGKEQQSADYDNSSDDNALGQIKTADVEDGFGSGEGGQNYRTLNRWQTAVIFITNEVGIGILSLPSALQTLGLIPGIIAIVGMGVVTTYTAYVLLQFYRRYPHVVNIVDCGRVVGGKPLEWVVAVAFVLNLCLTCASAGLTMSIALNTITDHAICTVAFTAFPIIACWLLCVPRKFSFIAHLGIPCTFSIIAAVLVVMISLGIEGPPRAPPGWDKEIVLVGNPSFRSAFTALLNIAFAYAGNQGFTSVMAEMRDPSRDFVPALFYLQAFAITTYTVVGAVIYAYAGEYVASPALGSAPVLPAKIAYGVLFPCLLGTGLVFGHTAIKYLYVLTMRHVVKSRYSLTTHNVQTWTIWIVLGTVFWIVAFVLANAIPVFSSILSISSAIFVSWFTFGISGVFWLYLNCEVDSSCGFKQTCRNVLYNQFGRGWKKTSLVVINWLIILATLLMNSAGLWASVTELLDIFASPDNRVDSPFTCADNSIF